ncbi:MULTISPECIES: cellulose binding domain-containing protein, partial [unclassified Nocardiopsis]|uniref:cellulose binding domain-containing protein n=1 Tax=unclassified Nocardiopsis TaxID=2649073 RepID=UPI001915C6A5
MSRIPRAPDRPSGVRRGLAATTSLIFGAALAVAASSPASAAPGCEVDYRLNDWGSGFTADVEITNVGDPVNGWTLE